MSILKVQNICYNVIVRELGEFMKKVLLLFTSLVLLTGCMRIDKTDIDDLVAGILSSKIDVYNHTNKGFKYYLPNNLKSIKRDEYNEILKDRNYEYYLYVDLVSYYNKSITNYKEVDGSYYSKILVNDNNRGVINIVPTKDKYLITVEYNYATVNVVVEESDIKNSLSNALIVVSTIKYNDDIIKKMLEENEFSSSSEIVNIFDTVSKDEESESGSANLENEDDYNYEEEVDDEIYDPDVIN